MSRPPRSGRDPGTTHTPLGRSKVAQRQAGRRRAGAVEGPKPGTSQEIFEFYLKRGQEGGIKEDDYGRVWEKPTKRR